MPDKVSPSQFAASVKSKYPEYKDVDDIKLTNAIISKYPEYKDVVDFGTDTRVVTPIAEPAPVAPVSKYQKAVNDDRSEIGKTLSTWYNNSIASLERLGGAIADIPAQFNIAAPGFTPTEIGKTQEEAKVYRQQPLSKRLEPAKKLKKEIAKAADVARSGYTTREEEKAMIGQFDVMDGIGLNDIQSLIASSGGMAVDMGLGALSGGGTFVLQGYNDAVEDFDSAAEKAGIEPDTAARGLYGIAGGVINGLLEKFAVDKIVGDTPVFRNIQRKAIANVLKNTANMTGKKAVDAIETAAVAEIKKLTSNLKLMGFRAAVEGGTEAAQAALEDGAKFASNLVQGSDVFNEEEIRKGFFQNMLNSGVAGGVMGPIFGAGADKAFGRNVNTQVLKDIAEAKTPEDLAAINDELATTFDENNFSQEERDAILNNAKRYSQIKQTLPEGTNPIAQTIAIPLIENRIKIDSEIESRKAGLESLDEALRADEQSSISLLEDKRAQINDDIREVVNNEKFNYFEKDGKFFKQLGENVPEEISKNRFDLQQIKTEGYATTTGEGKVQEGGTAGDISQREGTQKEGTQGTVNEADTGYRYIVSEEGSEFPITALVNKKVTKDGRPAILYQEGQRIVARILGTNRIEDVGNVNEMMNALPQDFGIEVQETVVTETPTGYRVEGEDMVNDSANPVDAISFDQNGNVMNVVLKTPAGKRRKFRGQAAKDLAYQITLKETIKNEDEFELFLEQEHQAELDAAEAKAVAEAETIGANEPVPTTEGPTTTKPITGRPTVTTEPAYGRFTYSEYFGTKKFLEGYSKLQKKVYEDANRVLDAINSILKEQGKEASINLHNQETFERAVIEAGGSKEDSTSRGFYIDADGSIHLNMDNLASDTVLHEGFHPILDILEKYNPTVINDLFAQLESIPEAAGIIAQAKENYTGDVTQKKEAITDFVAGVADGRIILNPTNFQKIKKFIVDMLNKIGISQSSPELMKVDNEQELINLAKFVTEKFTTGENITLQALDLIVGKKQYESGEGIDIDEDLPTEGTDRGPQFSKATIEAARKNIKSIASLIGTKISRVVFYDLTRVGPLDIKNIKTGYTPKVEGKGGPFYSYMQERATDKAVLAFVSINQAIQSLQRQILYPNGTHAIASQNPQTAHLGNKSTLAALFGDNIGLFQEAAKTPEQETEIVNTLVGEIDRLSKMDKGEAAKAVKKILKTVDLASIKTINDFRDKILLGAGNSFGSRGSIFAAILQGKQTKITAATRDSHKTLHYKYGIPTIADIAIGNNQKELSSAELGDVIKLVKPSTDLIIYTTSKEEFDKYSSKPTPEMKKAGIRIELLPESSTHESYPFILAGENVALLENYISAAQLYKKFEKLPKKKSFFSVGRMKKLAEAGEIPSTVTKEEGAPKFQSQKIPAYQKVPSEDVIKGFYSPIQKRINEFKLPNASSQKWKEIVGVKSDEAVFSGLADWLNSKKPNEQISKDDINKFIKDNRIQIKEIAKGGDYLVYNPKTGKDVMYFENADDAYSFVADAKEDGDTYEIDEPSQFLTTKYEEYQLPGGENYKEILITLPSNMSKLRDEMNQKYPDWGTNSFEDVFSKDDAIRYQKALDKGEFMSGHFDEANIITHLRMNTRTDADGKKVLFLEEVQSDWGQKGKKEGFGLSENDVKRLRELGYDYKDGKVGMNVYETFVPKNYNDLVGEAAKIARKAQLGVSPAPYVTNTNAWVKLGLKVALKEAVKQGADRIAWATGEQQNERYDLSKSIKKVDFIKVGENRYKYEALGLDGKRIAYDDNGTTSLQEIENMFGKDIAEKVKTDKRGDLRLQDEGLRVGGKGMKAFYGDATNTGIVGNVAKALVKELTGKEGSMEVSTIEAGEQPAIDITPELKASVKEGMPQFQKAPTKPITKEKLGVAKKTYKEQVRYGLLGKEGVVLKEKMSGELSAELATAETRVKSAMAIIKKYGGAVTEKDVSDFMEGVTTGNQLPDDLVNELTTMRAQIDGLTERLIQLGVIDNPESIAYYRENKGKYLLRSYESINFKENPILANFQGKGLNIDNVVKKLKNVDSTVVNAALKYLSDRAKQGNPSLTDEQAMKIAIADANEILSDSEGYIMNKGMTGSTNVKSLTQRKDISPEIRALMGEYTDPLYNYYATIFKISSLTSSRQYLNSLKDFGMGKFFFNEKTEDATVKFAGDESDALAPLNGIWTFPEIKESLQIAQKETSPLLIQMAGRVRMLKTVYNPATHVKNILGNMGFAISNGHWNNIPESYKYVRAAITGKTDEDIMKMMDTLNRYGLLNNVVGIGELKAYFDKNESVDDFLKTIYNNAEKSTTASRLGKAKANLSKIPKAIEKAYAIEDDVFKILAFVNESNRYAQALFSKKYDKLSSTQKGEIDNIATEIVKDTYPTFSRVPKGVKNLSKFMFLGNFLAFPVESVRTQYNSLRLARNEIVSGNKKLKAVGYTRLSGAIAYNSLFATLTMYAYNLAGAGITGAVGMLFGDDEKENDISNAIKKFLAPWNKNSDVYVSKFKDGILEYYDIGSLDSYGYQRRVWNAFWSTKNKGEFDVMMSAAIGELLDPWMTRDFVVDSYMKLSNNDNGRGEFIYNPEGKPMDKFKDMSLFAGKQFGPGFVGTSIKVADAYQKGEYEKVMDELGAQVFARRYTVDLNKQFQNYIYQEKTDPKKEVGFKYRLANAKKIYTDAKRQKLSPIELADKYREAVDAYKEILLTANEYYKSAALGGTNPKSLKASLDKSRIGRDEVKAIRTGVFSKFDRVYIPK